MKRTDFKKGDRVWSFTFKEWGTVHLAEYSQVFVVLDSNRIKEYMSDGSLYGCREFGRDLFFKEVKIPDDCLYIEE